MGISERELNATCRGYERDIVHLEKELNATCRELAKEKENHAATATWYAALCFQHEQLVAQLADSHIQYQRYKVRCEELEAALTERDCDTCDCAACRETIVDYCSQLRNYLEVYQRANRQHNDTDSALFQQVDSLLKKQEPPPQ
jgi:uncharacterized coiled-coil DUF342 family protein